MRICGLLYMQPVELPIEQIAKKSGYSLASISNTMKMLEGMGMVTRSKKPGSRKVYYFMEKGLVKINIQKLKAAQEYMVKAIKMSLPPMIEKYKRKQLDDYSKKRLIVIEDYYKQIEDFEQILRKWQRDLEKLAQKRG